MINKYKGWNSALRAIKSYFGKNNKKKKEGLDFIKINSRDNKLILTRKGMKFLEGKLNKTKQSVNPNAPSSSIPLSNLIGKTLHPSSLNKFIDNSNTNIDDLLKDYKNRLFFALKENENLKKENENLKNKDDYWNKTDSEHEVELLNLLEMYDSLKSNEKILQKEIVYLKQQNQKLQEDLNFYSGSENLLLFRDESKELLELNDLLKFKN
mgnify:CR=1 FL=1